MVQEHKAAIEVEVNAEGAKANVSEGALTKIGKAAAWVFPAHDAKVVLTTALTERVAAKIRSGQTLDDQEREFCGLMVERNGRKLVNQQAVAQRTREVQPEVEKRIKLLPPCDDRGTSRTFIGRAESIAADISEDELRELFARVLAGEACRPGSFSLRTLETIRSLDSEVAAIFERLRGFVFDSEWIFDVETVANVLERFGIGAAEKRELQDAGFVVREMHKTILADPLEQEAVKRYGDRQLRIRPAFANAQEHFWMESLRLTRIGREIASVLPPPPFHSEYFTGVGEWFAQLLGESGTVESRPESSDVWDVLKVDMNKFFEDSRPFELVFDEQSWQRNGDDFQIVIPARQHKKTSPTATVFHGRPPTFSECMCPVSTDADGGIVVTPSKPFAGKVVIK